MPRMDKLSEYRTTWAELPCGGVTVTYVHPEIVRAEKGKITLQIGGYDSVTTRRKMNQAANQFCLGYRVFAKDHESFVDMCGGDTQSLVDGMTFKAKPGRF